MTLICSAPWREAVTYRDTWPHEYVMVKKDRQRELFEAVRGRMCTGEGLQGRFFKFSTTYLFVGDYRYWFMTPHAQIDLDATEEDFVLNRVRLYRDRRDFLIQQGRYRAARKLPRPSTSHYASTDYGEKRWLTRHKATGRIRRIDAAGRWLGLRWVISWESHLKVSRAGLSISGAPREYGRSKRHPVTPTMTISLRRSSLPRPA